MKKIFVSLLTVATLVGCSDNNENLIIDDNQPVPIELGANTNSGTVMMSRAVINKDTPIEGIGIAGWEAKQGKVDYTAKTTWHTHITTTASPTGANVEWEFDQATYSSEPTDYTYMKAWYPCGPYESGGKPTLADDNKVHFDFTHQNTKYQKGEMDVLMADVVYGNKTDKGKTKTLNFQHMTAQLVFNVIKGEGLDAGTTIDKIVVKGISNDAPDENDVFYPSGFDLTKEFTDSGAILYEGVTEFEVPGITPKTQPITDKLTPAGRPIMIRPFESSTFLVDVVTNKTTYENSVVTLTGVSKMEAGTAYTIKLTFGQAGLTLNATVADWKTGSGEASFE